MNIEMNYTITIIGVFVLLISILLTQCASKKTLSNENSIIYNKEQSSIQFKGKIYPKRYNSRKDRANGHHFIVWSNGGNAKKSLINTDVPDIEILNALVKLGAKPGNNLTAETWTKRADKQSLEPDKRVKGSKLEIFIKTDQKTYTPTEMLKIDESSIDIHVGGHADLIPIWKSGCITCLFSCPGGRTSNAAYTVRDQHQNIIEFIADPENLPPDGTEVDIVMQLK
jgi:hypothetical protein